MARTITLSLTSDDDASCTLVIKTGAGTWKKTEPGNANKIFKTANGNIRSPGVGKCELWPGSAKPRTAELLNLSPVSVQQGAQGQGQSDETAARFEWVVTAVSET